MLTNTYECLAIILRSLRLVANCIRKPIRLIFATFWRICREYFFLHSQGYSPQCESSIRIRIRMFIYLIHIQSIIYYRNIDMTIFFLNDWIWRPLLRPVWSLTRWSLDIVRKLFIFNLTYLISIFSLLPIACEHP